MTNHELLNMIGDVNEDYVLAAGDNVARPRFRWGTLAACAACAALILAAYPAYRMSRPQSHDSVSTLEDAPEASQAPVQHPGLHEYTLVGDGLCAITAGGDMKAPEGGAVPGQVAPLPEPAQPPQEGDGPVAASGAYVGSDAGPDGIDGFQSNATTADAAVDEAAASQYDGLLRGMGMYGGGEASCPDWFAGAWIEHSGGPDAPAWLTVAIVDGFRTSELEQQILGWCGGTGEVLFTDAKYSQNYLDDLMKEIDRVFDELDCRIFSSYGVYPDNRVHLDFFEMPGDEVLAALAELDPDNSAIYIQVFTDAYTVPTDGSAKGPTPAEPAVEGE